MSEFLDIIHFYGGRNASIWYASLLSNRLASIPICIGNGAILCVERVRNFS